MFGQFLSWLNDHESDVFVVCTSNDITRLPPEFSRAERFDGLFFLDFPSRSERRAIWDLHMQHFELTPDQPLPPDESWTGAEIRACCRLAALLDLPLTEAARNIVPTAQTAGEAVERLRSWASGRCLAADQPGIYSHRASLGNKSRRSIRRDASNN
jgi:SpoVK/Ycf46/Vps4 family AAA+-type ATPase